MYYHNMMLVVNVHVVILSAEGLCTHNTQKLDVYNKQLEEEIKETIRELAEAAQKKRMQATTVAKQHSDEESRAKELQDKIDEIKKQKVSTDCLISVANAFSVKLFACTHIQYKVVAIRPTIIASQNWNACNYMRKSEFNFLALLEGSENSIDMISTENWPINSY